MIAVEALLRKKILKMLADAVPDAVEILAHGLVSQMGAVTQEVSLSVFSPDTKFMLKNLNLVGGRSDTQGGWLVLTYSCSLELTDVI